jgi:hypothetical protein
MRCIISALLATWAICVTHPQQLMSQHPEDPPQTVVRAAFTAYEAKRWGDFAGLVHHDALMGFRAGELSSAEAWEQYAAKTHELPDSTMAPAVAEYFNKMRAEMGGNPVLRQFADVKSLDELRALSPQEFLARYLDARSPKPDAEDPEYQPPIETRAVIGEVTESKDLVHVVYRLSTDVGRYGRTESIEVIPVRRAANGWRIMLNTDLSLGGSMRGSIRIVGGDSVTK